jgi:putative cell wall-binding protein
VRSGSQPLWVGKFLDRRTGEIDIVTRDQASGEVAGAEVLGKRLQAATIGLSPLELKGDAELRAAAGRATASEGVPVAVWLDVDATDAEQSVIDAHPELTWDGGRPFVDDLATARRIRAELSAARAAVERAALDRFGAEVAALGGSLGYASTSAPLAFVDMPATRVGQLAALSSVASLGLERTWTTSMSSAGPAVQADWTGGSGDQGNGVRVAVVEYHNVHTGGDLSGRVVASHSTTGHLAYAGGPIFDHPTWVAGAVAGRNSTYRGVAPGALIVSSSTGGGSAGVTRDRAIIAAADWAASSGGGDADVINASIGQDTATGSEEARRYFDVIAASGGRLPVAAAGNFVTFGNWDIVSPGTAYNVLTVGGIEDRNTVSRSDDRIWYQPGSNGSAYHDRSGTTWNPHGDYNKPNVSAPAASVRTANGLSASGTSVASPIVAGIAAQLIARAPSLALRPEGTRALIMAGAINRSPMPDGSRNADHEGTGTASALWANRLLGTTDGSWGGYRLGSMTAGQTVTQEIEVVTGQRIKVAVSWNSHPSGSSDRLLSDLDLRVIQPNGSAVGSFTFDNNYEWVEFIAAGSGTARIEIQQARFDGSSERYGLAWAKVRLGTPSRIAGSDRYGTAAAVSRAHYAAGVPVAYLTTGETYPDALAGGPAAGRQGGPILLTQRTRLPSETRTELARLHPDRIVVLGGTGVVSDGVVRSLDDYTSGSVERLAGVNRYATAAAISRDVFAPGASTAFVATGEGFADALAAGPAAIKMHAPLLLTRGSSLPSETATELERLRPTTIYVLGGQSVVGDDVLRSLDAIATGSAVRIAGADRFETAAAVAHRYFELPALTYVANGMLFPDALAAVPAAGRAVAPLLLTTAGSLASATQNELLRLRPARTRLIGGTAVVSDGVAAQLRSVLGKP